MEEYKDISRGLKILLDKAEEMGWNWEAYVEPDNRRTYVEIGQSSPAGEDFSMTIDFDEENQADSFKDSLESYYEDFDIDEHIEMWIEAKRSGTSGVPSTRELVKDAEAIDGMILELSQALQKVNIPVLVGSYTPPDENGEEIDTVDLELADGKKITAPAVVDVSALGCMDELEYELWHVIEDYMVQFGIRTQDDEPDWATVKAVQESILTMFTDAGVNFKFGYEERVAQAIKQARKDGEKV